MAWRLDLLACFYWLITLHFDCTLSWTGSSLEIFRRERGGRGVYSNGVGRGEGEEGGFFLAWILVEFRWGQG